MKEHTKEEVIALKKVLEQGVHQCLEENAMDVCSFGYEKGVLITGNDALYLLSLMKNKPEQKKTTEEIIGEIIQICMAHSSSDGCFDYEGAEANAMRIADPWITQHTESLQKQLEEQKNAYESLQHQLTERNCELTNEIERLGKLILQESDKYIKTYEQNLRNKERISQQREEIERLKKLASERFYHIESIQRNLAYERREVERLKEVIKYCQGKAYTIVETKNAISHPYVKIDAEKLKDTLDKALKSPPRESGLNKMDEKLVWKRDVTPTGESEKLL